MIERRLPMTLPRLTADDVRQKLDELYQAPRKSSLVAFFGTGDEQTLDTDHAGVFVMRPVRSELELRKQIPAVGEDDTRIAFLLPWATEVPPDLAARFVRRGRIHRVGADARLKRIFGVREVEPAALACPLSAYLLKSETDRSYSCGGGRLTLEALWSAWLSGEWGVDVQGGLACDALIAWAATDGRGGSFVAIMQDHPEIREALIAHLRSALGPSGPVIWKCWETGRGRRLVECAVLFSVIADNEDPAVRMWVRNALKYRVEVDVAEGDLVRVVRALGRAAGSALRLVDHQSGPAVVRSVVRDADALVDEPEVRRAVRGHRMLPSAWNVLLDELGEVLERGAAEPNAAAVARAREVQGALQRHDLYKDDSQTHRVVAADMAVRLLAWLAARPDEQRQGAPTPFADVEVLGGWYAEEGGYVDWARRRARGPAEDGLGRGIQAVVQAADRARDTLDRRFARALQAWTTERRHARNVLPVEHAVTRIGARFLAESPHRRLLVLLIDGMGWAQAVELLQSLAQPVAGWGPLAWHGSAKGRIGNSLLPVTIATLPTKTEVSRAAFFGGQIVAPGKRLESARDPERFRDHKELRKVCDTSDLPRLLMRSEGHTASGTASAEALSLIADRQRRVVGILINAIDASLRSDPQARVRWTCDSIHALPHLLDQARVAGRAVLIAADHGHVPADRMQSVGTKPKEGGGRWRGIQPGDVLHDEELAYEGEGVWTPRGSDRVALVTTETARWGAAPTAGEHGGATLAEVVVPCLLLGTSEPLVPEVGEDPAQRVGPAPIPAWWNLEVHEPKEAPARPAPRRPRRKEPDAQLGLPGLPKPLAPAPAPTAPTAPEQPSAFASSELLRKLAPRQQDRNEVIQAVEYLLQHRGVASEQAFAAAMGQLPGRIPGFVAKLQEVLNVEGYQVLRHAPQEKQVVLDPEKLAQQFEVKL